MLDRRAGGAVAQRLVDPRRMEREVLADAAVVDRDAGVLADEIALGRRRRDVAVDRLEYALARDRGLAVAGGGERVAQILRDVLQRPDVEVRGDVLDRALEVGGDVEPAQRGLPGCSAAGAAAEDDAFERASCPSCGCARACRRRSRRRRRAPRASSRRPCRSRARRSGSGARDRSGSSRRAGRCPRPGSGAACTGARPPRRPARSRVVSR